MAATFGVSEQALLLHSKRIGLISQNIANADTPNFKAKDIDFKSVLGAAGSRLSMSGTSEGHITSSIGNKAGFVNPAQLSLDGNTVDIEAEKVKLMEATQLYDVALQFVNGSIASKLEVIKGGK
ncbi:flagellar basal body rod protein FlgB [Pseudoalteromonas marina]|uniref:Flagellar basal body rod protein FlgB n=1 Tax=Pseudoalteromonas marina TaxID=267375 RepID=A0ABT9FC82_9GAMM|nr:flagellar basal body rod protein FlgB [Pseudoalteromonas marina]MDP2564356.1 flagellar basal body rod protein FlgB [Pseudoalteromonas marina]